MELAKDERATGRYECKPRACNVAEGEAAEAIAFFRGKAAKNEQKGKGSVGKGT